jgi:hypothetical protein
MNISKAFETPCTLPFWFVEYLATRLIRSQVTEVSFSTMLRPYVLA